MSCTLNAVTDLSGQHGTGNIFVSDSNSDFFHRAWEQVSKNPTAVISYSNSIEASDYISLAAQSFINETFRIPLHD
ncbi:MAG TPA: hypothetical protein VLG12_03065 [Candidatus Saccharimonadales bacterium]|nr:hypothetical protein [Candidatus Saccharimonadales bacterium]